MKKIRISRMGYAANYCYQGADVIDRLLKLFPARTGSTAFGSQN